MTDYARQAQESSTDYARNRIHEAALYLAHKGLSAETIAAAMLDCCRTATAAAVAYADAWDEAEARELAADVGDEIDQKREAVK